MPKAATWTARPASVIATGGRTLARPLSRAQAAGARSIIRTVLRLARLGRHLCGAVNRVTARILIGMATVWVASRYCAPFAGACLLLTGCESSDEAYDRGYNDGYAVGYNTACEIRATLIEGDWSNSNYSRGYADGQSDGTIACNNDRRAGVM
mgnify:CR=1 FL=1